MGIEIKTIRLELIKNLKMLSISTAMLLLLTSCADSFNDPCKDGNCSKNENAATSNNGSASISNNNNTESNSGLDNNGQNPIAIGIGSGGNSSNGETNQMGGFGLNTGNPSEGNDTNDFDQQNIYTEDFIIVDQLVDKVVETESLFSLQFVVYGTYPLNYEWFRKMPGTDVKIGTNQPVFYELNANFSHQGIYYAIVTDGNGKKLKSREATVHVVAGRNACDSEEYAPRYRVDKSGQLDWGYLFDNPSLIPRDKDAVQKIDPIGDSEFHIMACNYAVTDNFSVKCTGKLFGHVTYQCQNGKLKMIDNTCDCETFDLGGN